MTAVQCPPPMMVGHQLNNYVLVSVHAQSGVRGKSIFCVCTVNIVRLVFNQ